MPGGLEDIAAEERRQIAGKSNGTELESGDVVEFTIMGGGGYGDPLLRDSLSVAADVANGHVSAEVARDVYGVVLDAGAAVDASGTEAARTAILAERGEWQATADTPDAPLGEPGPVIRPLHGGMSAREGGAEGALLVCDHCDSAICRVRDDYKRFALRSVTGVESLPGAKIDPALFIDDKLDFIRYCCPSCKVLLTTEVVRQGSEPLPEAVLREVS